VKLSKQTARSDTALTQIPHTRKVSVTDLHCVAFEYVNNSPLVC